MGFVTREFVHLETLERAKKWLIEVGFHPSRIEIHTHGALRIKVSVEPGQADEVERVLDAVAAGDPDGSPSFWDQTHQQHDTKQVSPVPPASCALESQSFDIGWRPVDVDRDVTQATTDLEIEKQKAYRDGRE